MALTTTDHLAEIKGDACDADDDNDNLSDSDELMWETEPLVTDFDGDGMFGGAEVEVGCRPLVSEPALVGTLNFLLTEP